MTLQTILDRLHDIDREARKLMTETGFQSMDGFGSQVTFDSSDIEDRFLRDSLEMSMERLEQLHEDLHDWSLPVHGEYRLERFPEGRYGYDDAEGFHHVLTCGMPVEAKLIDREGESYWIRTRIEHNGEDYILWSHPSIPLKGLTIRERW